jgi:CubicO group peptidase (beta-lactamase class C family)
MNDKEVSVCGYLDRRRFIELLGVATASLLLDNGRAWTKESIDEAITSRLGADYAPGLAAGLIVGDRLVWSGGFGWADVTRQVKMTPDTVINIASVSKTITATAVMQLVEKNAIDLDGDVNQYVPFQVRNPRYPDAPITCRQLLAHRSSIKDGPAYDASYSCGDPTMSLSDWVTDYLMPGGRFYDAEENFHDWVPGTDDPPEPPRPYSNVAYGLLGFVVERVSGKAFSRYTAEHIFIPLGMNHTGWYIEEIDKNRHAVPYTRITEDFELPDGLEDLESFLPLDESDTALVNGDLFAHCLYSFPNFPDGLLRTNVTDLTRFLGAVMNGGQFEKKRLLKTESVATMLSKDHFGRGLCWNSTELGEDKNLVWYHSGSDPGVVTFMGYSPRDARGIVVLANCSDPGSGFGGTIRYLFADKDV